MTGEAPGKREEETPDDLWAATEWVTQLGSGGVSYSGRPPHPRSRNGLLGKGQTPRYRARRKGRSKRGFK